jgi:hypothetical protein
MSRRQRVCFRERRSAGAALLVIVAGAALLAGAVHVLVSAT